MRSPAARHALLGALVVGVLSGCGPSFEAPSLAAAVGPVFANLYVRAQDEQGRTGVTAESLHVTTVCARGGQHTASRGPGADWACMIGFNDGDGPFQQVLYETTLKPDGCFVADAPPAVVGDATFVDATGRRRVNPLYVLDGCL